MSTFPLHLSGNTLLRISGWFETWSQIEHTIERILHMPLPLRGSVDAIVGSVDWFIAVLVGAAKPENSTYMSDTAEPQLSTKKRCRKAARLPPIRLLLLLYFREGRIVPGSPGRCRNQTLLEGVVL